MAQRPENEFKVDLNDAAKEMKIRKRRLYDIKNAMEGFGMVKKLNKNLIKLRDPSNFHHLSNIK
jgi:hypothetical protein